MTVHSTHTAPAGLGDLTGQTVLVVGGCADSARTAARLQAAGATVAVISPDLGQDMIDLLVERRVTWQRREVEPVDLVVPGIVFGVSDHPRQRRRSRPAHHRQ